VLFDLDGTLVDGGGAVPGALEAVSRIREAGLQIRVVTNTTRRSRRTILATLRAAGLEFAPEEVFSATVAAGRWLVEEGRTRVFPLLASESLEDLRDLTLVDPEWYPDRIDAVLVGDMGADWTFGALNRAFRALREGALLVACQRNRCWKEPEGLSLDAGAFVAALEWGASVTATVIGKPRPAIFRAAIRSLDTAEGEVVVVGDDLEADVAGARALGLRGVLVLSGKTRAEDVEGAATPPDVILASVAELPEALGLGRSDGGREA